MSRRSRPTALGLQFLRRRLGLWRSELRAPRRSGSSNITMSTRARPIAVPAAGLRPGLSGRRGRRLRPWYGYRRALRAIASPSLRLPRAPLLLIYEGVFGRRAFAVQKTSQTKESGAVGARSLHASGRCLSFHQAEPAGADIERQHRGVRNVQALDLAGHVEPRHHAAGLARQLPQALAFGAEHQRQRLLQGDRAEILAFPRCRGRPS